MYSVRNVPSERVARVIKSKVPENEFKIIIFPPFFFRR